MHKTLFILVWCSSFAVQSATVVDCTSGSCFEVQNAGSPNKSQNPGITLKKGGSQDGLSVNSRAIEKSRVPRIVIKDGISYTCATENGVEKCSAPRKSGLKPLEDND